MQEKITVSSDKQQILPYRKDGHPFPLLLISPFPFSLLVASTPVEDGLPYAVGTIQRAQGARGVGGSPKFTRALLSRGRPTK